MRVEVVTPDEYMGDIIGDLNSRRGQVTGMEPRGNGQVVNAMVPETLVWQGYNAAGVEIYGNPDREGGPHVTGNLGVMPAFGGQLTQYEIVSVVCHERYTLGGADPTSEEYAEEYETWCSEESPVFAELEAGTYDYTSPDAPAFGEVEIMPIGPEAVPGSPPSAG